MNTTRTQNIDVTQKDNVMLRPSKHDTLPSEDLNAEDLMMESKPSYERPRSFHYVPRSVSSQTDKGKVVHMPTVKQDLPYAIACGLLMGLGVLFIVEHLLKFFGVF